MDGGWNNSSDALSDLSSEDTKGSSWAACSRAEEPPDLFLIASGFAMKSFRRVSRATTGFGCAGAEC